MQHIFEKYKLEPFVTEVYEKIKGYQGGTVTRSDLVAFLVGKGSVMYANVVTVLFDIDHTTAMQRVATLDASFQKMYATIVTQYLEGVGACMGLYENRYAGEIIGSWVSKMQSWVGQYAQSLPLEHKEYLEEKLGEIKKSAVEIMQWKDDADTLDFELRAIRLLRL